MEDVVLHPRIKAFQDMLATTPTKPPWELVPAEVRAGAVAKWKPEYLGSAADVASIEHRYIIGPTAELPIKIYTPHGAGPFPGIIIFHGGGWVAGNIDLYGVQHQQLAHICNAVVIAVNYQKAPEHSFPTPFDDCYATLEWVFANTELLNLNYEKIGVAGDSAGGNIAAAVALKARDAAGPKIAFQILIYPALDYKFDYPSMIDNATGYSLTTQAMKWYWDQYVSAVDDLENPYCRPMAEKNLTNLPPAFTITAELDPLRDEGEIYANRLHQAGVKSVLKRYDSLIHGFILMQGFLPEAREAIVDIANNVHEFIDLR
jgi:acetyl esterase